MLKAVGTPLAVAVAIALSGPVAEPPVGEDPRPTGEPAIVGDGPYGTETHEPWERGSVDDEYGLGAEPAIRIVYPREDDECLEGSELRIRWVTGGGIAQVRLYHYGDRCRLGGHSRGEFGALVTDKIRNVGSATWTVPWMDASTFHLRIAGFGPDGRSVASDDVVLRLKPAEMADLPATCVCILKDHQRLYYQRDGRIVRMHIISTAVGGYSTPRMEPGSYDRRRGAMGQVFRKAGNPRSRMYDVNMPYWLAITRAGTHGIHATSPRFYGRLGRPASHGCVRQHRADAKVLYEMVEIGTPVYVF